MDRRFLLVLLCFTVSGFAALLYETAWTREFARVFGTSELALVSVLAAYMGGLAAGAAVAARLAPRVRRPVFVYGVLELSIASCAIAVPYAMDFATRIYVATFASDAGPPDAGQTASAIFHVVAAFLILLPATGLMGATLPLLARHAVRRDEEIGRRIGLLYAANTAGAIAGALVAAFALLPALGLRHTVYVGALANALVFLLAWRLARAAPPVEPVRGATGALPGQRWILPIVAISGAISFVYEVLWTRLLSQLVGGTIQAFAIMLASFLLGIAGGSAAAARAATDRSRAAAGFALAQIGAGALSILAFASLSTLAALVARGGGGLPLGAAASVAVLLPASLCIGATFPFAVRIYTAHAADAATGSARVYAWNTLGAIVGAVGAGFALLPGLGFAGTVRVAVATNLTLALASSALARPRRLRLAIAAAAGLLVLLAFPLDEPWRLLRTSPLTGRPTPGDVAYFGVGRSATVLALKYDRAWMLSANGLPEAAIVDADASPNLFLEARWLGFLPVLARPDAESVLMIGLGGSTALEAIPSSVGSVEVIELEPEMVAANRAIHRARGFDPLDDPRVSLHLNDARGALLLTGARYDAIVSQPSHPWTAGASHLYTNGFFADVRARLQPGGVFVQWIGMSFIDEDLLRTLVATLLDAFPAVRVYQPSGAALLFVASDADMRLEQDAARALAASPGDFARYGVFTPEDIAAALVLDEAGARSFAEGGVINSDDRNLLAARAGRLAGGVALDPPSALRLLAEYDPLTPPPGEIDVDALVRRLVRRGAIARAARVAQSLTDPAAQQAAIGWIELGRRRPLEATRRFENALLLDPAALDPPAGLALVGRRAIADGAEAPAALTGGARAVVSGWRSVAVRDFAALRASDPELASVAPRDPLYREAIALRAHWRIVRGAAGDGATALALLDPILAAGADADAWLLRARAGVVANRPAAAHWALFEVQRRLRRAPDRRQLARGALRVLSAIPSGAEESGLRSAFEAAAR